MKYQIDIKVICETEKEYKDIFDRVSLSVGIISKSVGAKASQMIIQEIKEMGEYETN